MNSVTLGIFRFLWPLAVFAVLWTGFASLQRIDRVRLATEPSLCLRAGLPAHDGQCVMEASLSWRFPSGRQVVTPLDGGKPARPLVLTPDEAGSLSYGYDPKSFHSAGGMLGPYVLLILAVGLASLPFVNDIKSLFGRPPSNAKSAAVPRRR